MYWKDGTTEDGKQIYKYFTFDVDMRRNCIDFISKIVAADNDEDFLDYYELNKRWAS